MMTDWYQRSINALQLNGKGERTQEAYTRAVRMLSTFSSKPPDEITEPELETYFLRRRNVDHWSPNTMRICYCGIRVFFVHVLQHSWHLFDILRAKSETRLPAILSREEVRGIPAEVWEWNVNCQPAGDGSGALQYRPADLAGDRWWQPRSLLGARQMSLNRKRQRASREIGRQRVTDLADQKRTVSSRRLRCNRLFGGADV